MFKMGINPYIKLTADNIDRFRAFADAAQKQNLAALAPQSEGVFPYQSQVKDPSNGEPVTVGVRKIEYSSPNTHVFEYHLDYATSNDKDRTLYRKWQDINANGRVDEGDILSIGPSPDGVYDDLKEGETEKGFNLVGSTVAIAAKNAEEKRQHIAEQTQRLSGIIGNSNLNGDFKLSSDDQTLVQKYIDEGAELEMVVRTEESDPAKEKTYVVLSGVPGVPASDDAPHPFVILEKTSDGDTQLAPVTDEVPIRYSKSTNPLRWGTLTIGEGDAQKTIADEFNFDIAIGTTNHNPNFRKVIYYGFGGQPRVDY